ncbi:MAG: hypothetical protein M3P34_06310, partial [Actinomycetota bacterium]|nr:hypothetical protein [Actinomycetota bacterium]
HEALLEGAGTSSIREITAEQRRLVAELTDIAVRLLGPAGEGQRDAIGHTLDAAVADPDQGELVRSARLTKELAAPSGFGGLDVLFAQVTPGPPVRSTSADVAADAEHERAERRRKELELREWQARLERLRLEAERREAEAATAAQKVAALRQELEELTARLDIAQRRATAAAGAASAARAEVEQAEARD